MIEYPVGFNQPEMRRKPICGVLAVAICANVDYQVAHASLKRNMLPHQKRFGGRTYNSQQLKALAELAVKFDVTMVEGRSVAWCIQNKFKPGVLYMVTIRGHVMTVRDGYVCDQGAIVHWSLKPSCKKKCIRFVEIIGKGW